MEPELPIDGREPRPDRLDRRPLLKGIGAAGAAGTVAWVAPTIVTANAAAAATVPPTPPVASFYQSESVSGEADLSIQLMNLPLPGMLVLGVAALGTTTGSVTDPSWTLAGSRTTTAGATGIMAVYTKPAAASTESATFDVTGNLNVVGFLLYYANGTGREPAGAQLFNGNDASRTASATAIATTGPARVAVYVSSWLAAVGSPTPIGFTNQGLVTNANLSLLVADMVVPTPATVGPTTSDLGLIIVWAAGLMAIF